MSKNSQIQVSVCICTFQRSELLDTLIQSLLFDTDYKEFFEIIVVDNDAKMSASSVVQKYIDSTARVRYLCEPRQNIALARNRAVSAAEGDWIAMIDDDERPDPSWLRTLIECAERWQADGVFGPVIPEYPDAAPDWIRRGQFLEKPRLPDGAPMPRGETRTSNVLFRQNVVSQIEGPFDPRYGLTGGEDSRLFDRLVLEGRRLFWCDRAIVYETIPTDRMTVNWLVKRSFRTGQTFGRLFLDGFGIEKPECKKRVLFFGRALVILLLSIITALFAMPFSRIFGFRWVRMAATQVGKLSALTPYVFEEYEVNPRIVLRTREVDGGAENPPR